jgi:excisionase family DNA binding protein
MATRLMTASQVGELLDVDPSTVYRMAADGRLDAVRVGRQWRFPREEIDALLGREHDQTDTRTNTARRRGTTSTPSATQLLETVAPALGVTMVVTDLDGQPLTPVVNPAPGIAARLEDPDFLPACTSEWRHFAAEAHLAPRLQLGHFGFLCAHSLVRRGPMLVAMVLAGGIAPESVDPDARPDLFHLDAVRRGIVLDTLPRTAALLSQLLPDR